MTGRRRTGQRSGARPQHARPPFGWCLALCLVASPGAWAAPALPAPPAAAPVAAAAVRITLGPAAADAQSARVLVNGKPLGHPPLELALQPGRYLVEVDCPGYAAWRHWLDAAAGQSVTLVAALEPVVAPASQPVAPPTPARGRLTVTSTVVGAEVFVDGERLGSSPLDAAELLAGPHVVAVRAPGHDELLTTVEVQPGAVLRIAARLRPTGSAAPAAVAAPAVGAGEADRASAPGADGVASLPPARVIASHAATLVSPGWVAGDLALGFPYLVAARFTVGLLDRVPYGLDGGVELRSFGALTEVGARARVRLIDRDPWSLATSLALGGGGGPKSRNTFFVDLAATGTWWLRDRLALSGRTTIDIYTDRLCPARVASSEVAACSVPPAGLSASAARGRFTGLRLLFAGIVELPVNDWLNLFGLLEFAPWQGNRRAFSDPFVALMPDSDSGLYGCVGVTLKR